MDEMVPSLMGTTDDGTTFALRSGECLHVVFDEENGVWLKCCEPAPALPPTRNKAIEEFLSELGTHPVLDLETIRSRLTEFLSGWIAAASYWRQMVGRTHRDSSDRLPLSDGETLLFLARSLFFCDPRIVAHVVPRADATLPTTRHWSSEKYDAAFARAWELGQEEKNDLEWRCRNEALGRASHVLVDVRTTGHVLVLLKPA